MKSFAQQRFAGDCQVACLAMFLDVSYDEVVKHVWGSELIYGLADGRDKYIAALFEVEIGAKDTSKLRRKNPAVLTVPSLNDPNGSRHVVYWDGKRVWDPLQGVEGKKTYTNQRAWKLAAEGFQRVHRRKRKASAN